MARASIEWIFDQSPASGARTGGNVAEYAFRPDVDTLVREVIQNVLDNVRADSGPAQVVFRLVRLTGGPLGKFLDAVCWDQVRKHIEAAGREKQRFMQAVQNFDRAGSLLLLVIEDRNTTGLIGEEKGGASNFAALCRNTLYSTKPSETAGGSYGLGKAVLWLFSDFSTVLFNSVLEADPSTGRSPRFIGRTELPWHRVDGKEFSGSGWLGQKVDDGAGVWARSIWLPEAGTIAERLYLERDSATGTSILVVGFHNPADEDQEPQSIAEEMVKAVVRNFWPSVISSKLEAEIEVIDSGRTLLNRKVVESDINQAFAACWKAYQDQRTAQELTNPGDVAEIPIPLTIPARIDSSKPPVRAEASLVVRFAADDNEDGANQVALFRGTGMVVKYESLNSRVSPAG